ncbi:MAG: FkbM family methyltransferase, partial [Oscillospiraceae bacterium]|nr:FkbM family methyltransferase [Oscillospiraceae bacterium]
MWNRLKTTDKPIVLYGMGNGADRVLDELEKRGITASGVFASDGFVRGHSFRGFPVTTYAAAKERFGEMIVLVCFGSSLPDVMQRIREIDAEQELYMPDLPVCGGDLFDKVMADTHAEDLAFIRSHLADEASVRCFDETIAYKLSGKIAHLSACETTPDEAYENILKLTDGETYLDLGAYNGDTVAEFLAHVNGYRQIIALEPDPKNYKKLVKNTEHLENIRCINAGIYKERCELSFAAHAGRNSAVGAGGRITQMESVDSLLNGEPVSYIKMDVEGQEQNAILGAVETIRRCKPKMLVSCYHRSEDLFTLPMEVFKLRDD